MKKSISKTSFHENNFNGLRFFAAFQVGVVHILYHLKISDNSQIFSKIYNFLSYFPGVIVFFAISGFLISKSYNNSHNLRQFYFKRFLRIYPALFLSTVLLSIYLLFFIPDFGNIKSLFIWLFGQLSFFQFYTPDELRFWGCGTPNGSLWTISIELQFYLICPFIMRQKKMSTKIIIFVFSIIFNLFLNYFEYIFQSSILIKLLNYTIFKYLWIFMLGIFFRYINFKNTKNIFFLSLFLYALIILFTNLRPSYRLSFNSFLPIFLISLFSLSYGLLNFKFINIFFRNDYSYGFYLYHMIFVNIFIQFNLVGNLNYLFVVIILTLLMSMISWNLVESKFIKLKFR